MSDEIQQQAPPVPSLPTYVATNAFVDPKQQGPLLKAIKRMMKPKHGLKIGLPKRMTRAKHKVKFY